MSNSTASPAITIGSYALPSFVRLNIRACRVLWPDAPILVSDDKSASSGEIEEIADEEGASYIGSSARMSHCTGDLQSILNALAFAEGHGRIALKVSQRLIPASMEFRQAYEEVMSDPAVWFAHPGQIGENTVCRPSAKFFARFTKLTDVIAARPERINRAELVEYYKEAATCPASKVQLFVEVALDRYVTSRLEANRRTVPGWTNPVLGVPKSILRRSQSSVGEYHRLATKLGCPEKDQYPLNEWLELERAKYKCLADVV